MNTRDIQQLMKECQFMRHDEVSLFLHNCIDPFMQDKGKVHIQTDGVDVTITLEFHDPLDAMYFKLS